MFLIKNTDALVPRKHILISYLEGPANLVTKCVGKQIRHSNKKQAIPGYETKSENPLDHLRSHPFRLIESCHLLSARLALSIQHGFVQY